MASNNNAEFSSVEASSIGDESDANFKRLPAELVTQIFGHLDLRERMNVRLVNQRWNKLVLNSVQLKLRFDAGSFFFIDNGLDGIVFRHNFLPTRADFVLRNSSSSAQPRISVPGSSLNAQIKRLPESLMDRVFEVRLELGKGCATATGLLAEIANRLSRRVKLHLASERLPLSVFSSSAMADATIVSEFPELQLQSLSTTFKFHADGDRSVLNYLRMDRPRNGAKYVKLRLKHCGHASDELPFIVERFPQLTKLKLEFIDGAEKNQRIAPPDWQTLSQLTKLQKLTIVGSHVAELRAPELSTQRRLPELRALRLYHVQLSANATFFRGTPNLESLSFFRCEHALNGASMSRTDINAIASAIRNGHLKQLKNVVFCLSINGVATSLEYVQLLCKAIAQTSHGCPNFQQLTWSDDVLLDSSEPNEPSLCKTLSDLPAGMLCQRPFTLQLGECDLGEIPESADERLQLIDHLTAAMQRCGLKRLRLSEFPFLDFPPTDVRNAINANSPTLTATVDEEKEMLRVSWMHPTIEDYEQQIEMAQ